MLDFGKAFLNPSKYHGPDEEPQRGPTGSVRQRQGERPLDPDVPSPPSGSDSRHIAQLLQALVEEVEGRPLASIIPRVPGLARLIGADAGRGNFTAFLDALNQGITEIGLGGGLVSQPAPAGEPSGAGVQRRRSLSAGLLGVSPHTEIAPGRPISCRRFDDFAAAFSDAMTVEGAVAEGLVDGWPPAAIELVGAMITAIRNSLLRGDPQSARQAGSDAAAMITAVWQVLNGGEPAQRARRSEQPDQPEPGSPAARLRRVPGGDPSHYAMEGYEGTCREFRRRGAVVTHMRHRGEDEWRETSFAGQEVVDGRVRPITRR